MRLRRNTSSRYARVQALAEHGATEHERATAARILAGMMSPAQEAKAKVEAAREEAARQKEEIGCVLASLKEGDKVTVVFEPRSSSSPNDKRTVVITSTAVYGGRKHAYFASGRVRSGNPSGGAIMDYGGGDYYFQPTMAQQIRRIVSLHKGVLLNRGRIRRARKNKGIVRKRNPGIALVFYHGAQKWEGSPEIVSHRKGHAEHGPGIYLTTSWQTAKKYAKGGGSVYRMELAPTTRWLQHTKIQTDKAVDFINSLSRIRNKKDILASVLRLSRNDEIQAEYLVNAFVNADAASGQHGPALAEFLTRQGADASLVKQSGEDWVVVFNPRKIVSTRKLTPKDVDTSGFEFDLPRHGLKENPKRKSKMKKRRNPSAEARYQTLSDNAVLSHLRSAYSTAKSAESALKIAEKRAPKKVESAYRHYCICKDDLNALVKVAGSRGVTVRVNPRRNPGLATYRLSIYNLDPTHNYVMVMPNKRAWATFYAKSLKEATRIAKAMRAETNHKIKLMKLP